MSNSPASVLHVASHRINVGDGALIGVIQRRIRAIAGSAVDFSAFDIVDLEPEYGGLSFNDIDLAAYELILVGGGGMIDNRRTRTASGMAFPMSGDDIRRSPTPLAFIALGYNLFPGTRLRHEDALADVLRACAEREFPMSVRNDGSLERLRDAVGPAADTVTEVPDPGFFVDVDPDVVVPQFSGRRPRVLLQVAGDNPGFRFSPNAGDLMGRVLNRLPLGLGNRLVAELAAVTEWLVTDRGAEVVIAPHISTDLALTSAILRSLPTRVARKSVRVLGVPDPARASQFFAAYAQADLVIGMRGHSVICACGLRVPCVGLATHSKVSGFMAACGLDDAVVELDGKLGKRLREVSSRLLDDPSDHLQRLEEGTRAFDTRLTTFLERSWRQVSGSGGVAP